MTAKIAACFVFGIALTGAPSPAAAGSLHNPIVCTIGTDYTYPTKRRRRLARIAQARLPGLWRALTLALSLALTAPAHAGDWTGWDTGREAAYQTLLAVDCAQTRYIASHPGQFEERNPFLGEHPSKGQINNLCAVAAVGHYLVSRHLPTGARGFWQAATIIVQADAVAHNYHIGLRVEF